MIKLLKLQTEYQAKGVIDVKNPRFSWQFGKENKTEQVSYRIRVATKETLLSTPDMWDSGEIKSNFAMATYEGKELVSNSLYYVQCEAKDGEGNLFSEITSFETALYKTSDWKGSWVALPDNFNGGTILFRKVIEMPTDKKIVRAKAYVCGLGYHEFFVNGKKMGDSVLNPSVTEYVESVEYCAYDMEGLTAGQNVIGVEVAYGWFGARKLLAQFYVEFDDGSVYEDHSGPCGGWWCGGSPTIDNSIYGGEVYDARIEEKYPLNWNTLDYEPTWANGWMYTIYSGKPSGKLKLQTIEPIRVCATFPEKSRKIMPNGNLVVDIGKNMAGWVRITVQGERGAEVLLKFGEDVTKDGYVNQLNLRSARCSDTYILRGEGVEEFAPRFTYHGFRYVQVSIKGKAELLTCVGEHVHTDTKIVGKFNCSDAELNALHEISVFTEHNNQHSILTDCPQRDERFGWLNDLGSRIYQTMYNVNMARFIPKFIRDITETQREHGEIADTAPFYTGGVPADPVCVIYPLLADLAYKHYGDKKTAEVEYEKIRKWVEYLLSRSVGYIMDYAYYADWVSPFKDIWEEPIYVSSAYLYWHLKEMVRLAKLLGKEEDAAYYEEHLQKSKIALNEKYFDEATCNYSKGTQTGNALALSIGFADERYLDKIAENVYTDLVKNNYHITSGNIGYRHVFYVLADYGYVDAAIAVLKNPEYPGWGYMIQHGATSVWERWESEMQNEMHSFNHPMFGSYDAFLYKYLGGICVDEDAAASNKVTIAPLFASGIDYVDCSLETVNGEIKCCWKKENGKVNVSISVPPQTVATVKLGDKTEKVGAGEYQYTVQ